MMMMEIESVVRSYGNYRLKLVGSLSWGISTVVDYWQTSAQATNLMVTQDTDKDFI